MLNTRFSEEELTTICQIMKRHGTDCATLVDVLRVGNLAGSNDAKASYKHVRLLKEFGVIGDRDILCKMCVDEAIDLHAETCEEYKKGLEEEYGRVCDDSHYDFEKCGEAVWMVDWEKIKRLEDGEAKKRLREGRKDDLKVIRGVDIAWDELGKEFREDIVRLGYEARRKFLEDNFGDISEEIRHNHWLGFLCDRHIGSMREYADRIIGY